MPARRFRVAVFFGATAGAGVALVFGCSSSDQPPPAGDTPLPDAAAMESATPADARRNEDVGRDHEADVTDAGTLPQLTDDGSCLDQRPAPTIDGGFQDGDDAGVPICPTTGTCVTYCNDIAAHYKLGVAQVAVTCMRRLPSCSVDDVRLCVDQALGATCQDTTAPGACTPIVKRCDPNAGAFGSSIDQNGCEYFMRGLNPTGRGLLTSCIENKIDAGTCVNEVGQCVEQLWQ